MARSLSGAGKSVPLILKFECFDHFVSLQWFMQSNGQEYIASCVWQNS
jgi:hypothetical protein